MRTQLPPMGQQRRDEGTAMIIVVGFLAVLMIGSATFFSLLHRTMSHAHGTERRQVCLNLAEGGLDKALADLRARHGVYAGEQETALGEGMFSVEVRHGSAQGVYHVTSTGFLRDGVVVLARARVAADVLLAPDGVILGLRWTEVRSW